MSGLFTYMATDKLAMSINGYHQTNDFWEAVTGLLDRARRVVGHRLDKDADAVSHLRARVVALSPQATLDRGYAVVQRADGHVVRDPADVDVGDALRVRVAAGDLAATVAAVAPTRATPA